MILMQQLTGHLENSNNKKLFENNMGQTRHRHLSLKAIENKTASSLDLKEVIDTFAKTSQKNIMYIIVI